MGTKAGTGGRQRSQCGMEEPCTSVILYPPAVSGGRRACNTWNRIAEPCYSIWRSSWKRSVLQGEIKSNGIVKLLLSRGSLRGVGNLPCWTGFFFGLGTLGAVAQTSLLHVAVTRRPTRKCAEGVASPNRHHSCGLRAWGAWHRLTLDQEERLATRQRATENQNENDQTNPGPAQWASHDILWPCTQLGIAPDRRHHIPR